MTSRDKKPAKSPTGRIRSLPDLNLPCSHDSDSDSDAPQDYHTGGEKSGMLTKDPTRDNDVYDVDEIFNRAMKIGVVERPPKPSSSRSFAGTGRFLSEDTEPSAPQQSQKIVHTIVFWRNGFSVNDGPLRRFYDPENEPFLESIMNFEWPEELVDANSRSRANITLIRMNENFPEQKVPQPQFQGVRRTLGSSSTDQAASTSLTTDDPPPSRGLILDISLPSSSFQLRLSDGTCMVAHFNNHHTVGDIRAFIDAAWPGGSTTYQLQKAGFPPKLLSDLSQTIEQAGLANSVVIQKL